MARRSLGNFQHIPNQLLDSSRLFSYSTLGRPRKSLPQLRKNNSSSRHPPYQTWTSSMCTSGSFAPDDGKPHPMKYRPKAVVYEPLQQWQYAAAFWNRAALSYSLGEMRTLAPLHKIVVQKVRAPNHALTACSQKKKHIAEMNENWCVWGNLFFPV
jgi:hypothetical protein